MSDHGWSSRPSASGIRFFALIYFQLLSRTTSPTPLPTAISFLLLPHMLVDRTILVNSAVGTTQAAFDFVIEYTRTVSVKC